MDKDLYKYETSELNMRRCVTTGEGNDVSFALHSHTDYEIFMLTSEKASFFAEGTIYQMSRGDVIIFNNTELHNISFDNSHAYERFVIHFRPEAILPFDNEKYNLLHVFTARKSGKNNFIPKNRLETTDFYNILEKMESVVTAAPDYLDIYFHTLFIQLLIALNDASSLSVGGDYPKLGNEKIRNILSYINTNLTEDLSLDTLAEQFYMSKYNMCHLFKATTGFSVKQYITYRRVAMAQKLMASGKSTLDACVASGFNDYSNFYKTFKKLLGVPPKNFK